MWHFPWGHVPCLCDQVWMLMLRRARACCVFLVGLVWAMSRRARDQCKRSAVMYPWSNPFVQASGCRRAPTVHYLSRGLYLDSVALVWFVSSLIWGFGNRARMVNGRMWGTDTYEHVTGRVFHGHLLCSHCWLKALQAHVLS